MTLGKIHQKSKDIPCNTQLINPFKMQLIPCYPIHHVKESNRNESIIDIILNNTKCIFSGIEQVDFLPGIADHYVVLAKIGPSNINILCTLLKTVHDMCKSYIVNANHIHNVITQMGNAYKWGKCLQDIHAGYRCTIRRRTTYGGNPAILNFCGSK